MNQKLEDKKYSKAVKILMNNMVIFTLIVAAITFVATIILGIFNYRINSQASEVAKSFGKVLKKYSYNKYK